METAGIALNASLAGHLVFSTLHNLDKVTRLIDRRQAVHGFFFHAGALASVRFSSSTMMPAN
jgi:Tfp pilus assembly pilus retraction ATPase PilT